ncbi:acyl-ACP--UDP-N-acetylglucosamine O-acyltransferase [Rickettsia endosymbiont of Cardiosporidium cionae]|uniref:acyl-ACP--UDP-N-acetylglucosamine O-acyltransferase n=1 Tax=Rickettsia endosymbiont of Cardiosporidium cionae TaxID=2777155 RepID=UPI00189504D7|nr:acyl-ACP--UDP-N-acetylglucosamine O-acyltransferase [Rickettsia endosymbiont of Cardiosporidium cionae]KAF8818268.1 acyl-ACP--UDP-N-acetylglucosamine O-acyltransferase [Rickettsia endosymbiont of Cardiosporidium cionae]
MTIHQTAIVDKGAKIGDNVSIGPYCVIGSSVTLGDDVIIKNHVVIDGITSIGSGSIIYSFASIGSNPQDLKYNGEKSKTVIGKNNIIREYVTIQPGTKSGGMITSVGNDCLFMIGAHIAHDCKLGNNIILANYVSLGGHVEIGDYAIIGGMSAVLQKVRIGNHAMLGGLSGLDSDLIPFGIAKNDRAKLSGLNLIGMKRRNFDHTKSLEANRIIKSMLKLNHNNVINSESEEIEKKLKNHEDNKIIQDITKFITQGPRRNICGLKKCKQH